MSTTQAVQRTPWLSLFLRSCLMGGLLVAFAWRLTTTSGLIAGVLMTAPAVWLGHVLASRPIRLWWICLCAFVGMWLCLAMANACVSWDWPSALFGASLSLAMAEAFRWGGAWGALLVASRVCSARYKAFVVLELVVPLWLAAWSLASHRDGNLHRPQQMADWSIEQGQDPMWLFVIIGLIAAVVVGIGLMRIRGSRQLLRGALFLILLGVGAFVLFSRFQVPALVQRVKEQSNPKSQIDKNKKMKPPPRSNQPMPVAVVNLRQDFEPPSGVFYFRQRVLSHFNGLRLVETTKPSLDRDQASDFPVQGQVLRVPSSIAFKKRRASKPTGRPRNTAEKSSKSTKTLLDALGKMLTPDKKAIKGNGPLAKALRSLVAPKAARKGFKRISIQVSLLRKHHSPFALAKLQSLRGVPNPNPRLFLRSYIAESVVWMGKVTDPKRVPGEADWPKSVWAHYTNAPRSKRYRTLVSWILKKVEKHPQTKNPIFRAMVLKRWLEDNLYYSMKRRYFPNVRDPVAHFLFKSGIGYCVHFSHAAIYMMRSIGIPARLAEGYAVRARYRGGTSTLLVRDVEAHAWPEIYLRGVGWVPFDVHPRRSLDPATQAPDPNLRQMLSRLSRKPKKLKFMMKEKKKEGKGLTLSIRWDLFWKGAFGLILLCMLSLFCAKFWRRFRWRWSKPEHRVALFFRALEDRLYELGQSRERGEPLELFASRMVETLPSLRGLLEPMIAQALGSRLPPEPPDSAQFSAVQREMRAAFPWYLRTLRLFDPVSWTSPLREQWRREPPTWWTRWQNWRARLSWRRQRAEGKG